MSQDEGPQYALHIAMTTLKDRCKGLQDRVDSLERENMKLKMKQSRYDAPAPDTEMDDLRATIVKLTEQKAKLRRDMTHVAAENKELWSKLAKILEINKSLGGHLTKINDSINQHSKKTLIRSTTFTQSDTDARTVNKAITENNQISLELEDVSLKLISNITKEKTELEAQSSEIVEMQKSMHDSLDFAYYSDELDDGFSEDFEQQITDLKLIKDKLNEQNRRLQQHLHDISLIDVCRCQETKQNKSQVKTNDVEEEMQLQSLARWGTPENSNTFLQENKIVKNSCPMCSKEFPQLTVPEFVHHVESHFKL